VPQDGGPLVLVAVVAQFLKVEPDIAVGGLAQALALGRVRCLQHSDDRRDILENLRRLGTYPATNRTLENPVENVWTSS
jgi:hypothetical protein